MPVTPTYPGLYVEEIPSGVRAITGVSTSVAVFVGWAAKGPVDRAQRILSWQDYERHFGGLERQTLLGYAVSHFFNNGGQDAYAVRIAAKAPDPDPATSASVTLAATGGDLVLTAKNPGAWAEAYAVKVKRRVDDTTRFRLQIVLAGAPDTVVESFENLSLQSDDSRYVKSVVDVESTIINASVTASPTTFPGDIAVAQPLAGGEDGTILTPNTPGFEAELNAASASAAIRNLDRVDLFNLLCIPGEANAAVLGPLEKYCHDRRAFLIVDCAETDSLSTVSGGPPSALSGEFSKNAAFYFPWVNAPDPLQENHLRPFPPCGFVAGIYARTDASRGVFKAPAGIDASVTGSNGVLRPLTDLENGVLNPQAINCIRQFQVYGTVVWGARTLAGNDERASEWKYVPVRRLALLIEESLYRGTKWVVFEANDDPLWAQIRLNIGAFMQSLFRQGAFAGRTPREAYFVKCDRETTTQDDVNRGIVNILVGFAPLKPAEFVILKIQQMAGQPQA